MRIVRNQIIVTTEEYGILENYIVKVNVKKVVVTKCNNIWNIL